MKARSPARVKEALASPVRPAQGVHTIEDAGLLGNAFVQERMQDGQTHDRLEHRTLAERLTPSEVSTDAQPDVPLSPAELAALIQELEEVGDPSASPIQDALSDGTASVESGQVRMPGLGDVSSGEAIGEGTAQMHPKDTRVETDGERYDVFARLNPWVRIAGGTIAEIDPNTHHLNGVRRADPAWSYLTLATLAQHGLGAHDLGVGMAWPPQQMAQEEDEDAVMKVDEDEDEDEAMEVDEEHPAPLRDAFRHVRVEIERNLGRGLTTQEWEVIADHEAEGIRGNRECGIDPVKEMSGPAGASCMPTADRLYALIGSGNEQVGVQDSVANGVAALADAIEADDASGIFYVKFGPNHGFVVLVQGGHAELVQSFAGDESLATNLETDGYTYSAEDIAGYLRDLMIEDNTAAAQEALFGDGQTIDENGHSPLADTTFAWKRSDLPADLEEVLRPELEGRARALFPGARWRRR